MANKYYRKNLKSGTNPFGRKSNLAKIMETFGPKKKNKKEKPKKRMFASVGGGADTGKVGEMKSKIAVAMDKLKSMEPGNARFSKGDIERILKMMESKNKKVKSMANVGGGADYINTVKPEKRGNPAVVTPIRKNRMGGGMMSRRIGYSQGSNSKPISKSKNPGLLAMSKTEKGKEAIKKMKFDPNRIVAKKGGKA